MALALGLPASSTPHWMPSELDESLKTWSPLLKRFVEISCTYYSFPGYVARRLKQWGKYASQKRKLEWVKKESKAIICISNSKIFKQCIDGISHYSSIIKLLTAWGHKKYSKYNSDFLVGVIFFSTATGF
jgi:hypothetical protein